ncbi:MAG: AmmeMemoRadiSam system protein B [Candidatus Omnitrophica bacterium]|nr:AmmeMemoRadiSam system protein B [Candidatus Omnitrophota bacterium]
MKIKNPRHRIHLQGRIICGEVRLWRKISKVLILLLSSVFFILFSSSFCDAQEVKQPNVSGRFYPADRGELTRLIDNLLTEAKAADIKEDVLVLISPHAGYEFSGKIAAAGYKAVKNRHYDTVIILAPSHYAGFKGAALWPKGAFRTPLGSIPVDEELSYNLMLSSPSFISYPEAFESEHSLEVQLPFLQSIWKGFKIVPIVLGEVNFTDCQNIAQAITNLIKDKNCLIVASSDMYHGFDYKEAELVDRYTLSLLKQMRAKEFYEYMLADKVQLCGWAGVLIAVLSAGELEFNNVVVIDYTNSAKVTGKDKAGEYCVGYSSVAICKQGGKMLSEKQQKRLLGIARSSIEHYLKKGEKLEVNESDPVLLETRGAFVTLHKLGELRGCIGNMVSQQPLYLTIRDMAVEAAVSDPRFSPVKEDELSGIEIEISVLSALEKIDNPDKLVLGKHGVLIKNGYHGGVFLPQVATETGWSKEEFLSNLCAHKAGLAPFAWKDPDTEIFVFTAEVFSE